MNEDGPIAEFISQLRTELRAHPRQAERIVAECLDHLIEAAREFQASGLPPEVAERKAVMRFGSPKNIARLFESLGAEGMIMQEKTRLLGIKILAAFFIAMAGAQFLAGLQFVLRNEVAGAVPVGVSAINAMLGIGLWKLRNWSRIGILIWSGLMALWSCLMLVASATPRTLPFLRNAPSSLLALGGLLTLMLSGSIIWYLYRSDVKETFKRV
jgi:hypothetical protein